MSTGSAEPPIPTTSTSPTGGAGSPATGGPAREPSSRAGNPGSSRANRTCPPVAAMTRSIRERSQRSDCSIIDGLTARSSGGRAGLGVPECGDDRPVLSGPSECAARMRGSAPVPWGSGVSRSRRRRCGAGPAWGSLRTLRRRAKPPPSFTFPPPAREQNPSIRGSACRPLPSRGTFTPSCRNRVSSRRRLRTANWRRPGWRIGRPRAVP